jgi:glyoxylase-like metal-dependent hydrolase (beta-lactamase superfamily II)
MKVKTLAVGMFQENCHILYDDTSKEAVAIDPGDEGKRINKFLDKEELTLKAILLTHGHIDHVLAVPSLKDRHNVPIYLHPEDEELYHNVSQQGALFGLEAPKMPPIDQKLNDGESLSVGGFQITSIHTPGHSPGSVCFLVNSESPILFAGDTLFQGSIGRTDLWGGSFEVIQASIREKLYTLPAEIEVYCGHGPTTTIGYEKNNNPFVSGHGV